MFKEFRIKSYRGLRYGEPVSFIELCDTEPVTVFTFGDGLKKVLSLASSMVKVRRGVLLIDEFGTGIHKNPEKTEKSALR